MEKIAFIGAGIMGKWMIRNLMRNGYEMTVYDVRSEAVEDLVEEGAFYRGSLEEAGCSYHDGDDSGCCGGAISGERRNHRECG